MGNRLDEFRAHRQRMNERILEANHLGIKRFFNLDTMAYEEGALSAGTKELLGLVAAWSCAAMSASTIISSNVSTRDSAMES